MRRKTTLSESASERRARAGAASPRHGEADADSCAAIPRFDPGPLDDLKAMLAPVKFVALVDQLLQGLESRLERLAAQLDAASWSDAAQGAHDVVSVAGNVGAARLSALARDLEQRCKTGEDMACRAAARVLRAEASEALRALKTYQSALSI